jgi:predicted molibdopterin-dependent oxidoreductase YjgC
VSGDLRIDGVSRGEAVEFTFEGRRVTGHKGETVAMALWADGCQTLRNSSRDGAPRAVLCNMGICYECLVRIDGAVVRSCMTEIEPGMKVERGGKS